MLTDQQWVAIGIAIGSFLGGVIMWLVKRRVARIDALESEVFSRDGLRKDIARLAEEAVARENRILSAISDQSSKLGTEMQELRTEVSEERHRLKREIDQRIDNSDRNVHDITRRIDGLSRLHRA